MTAVDLHGNSIVVEDKKITVTVKLGNGFRATRTFSTDHAPPILSDAVNQIIKHIRHTQKN